MAGLARRPVLHTIARSRRRRAFPMPAIAALKTFRLGERVLLSGRMGEIAGSGLFDLSTPVRQERCRQPPVPAGAALRGAHRGARRRRRRNRKDFRVPSFNYDFPYASKKLPVFAANVVASSQHLAATAGLRMLAKGGNAVDAAIASAIAITVVEPTMNGIGSDAFCILWDGTKLVGLNASGHSPALMTPDQYEGQAKMPSTGWGSVSVPGAVSLWVDAAQALRQAALRRPVRAGDQVRQRRLPRLLHGGAPVGRAPSTGCKGQEELGARRSCRTAARRSRARCGSSPTRPGRSPRSPRARARPSIAASSPRRWTSYAKETGGALRRNDLAEHKADWVDPIGLTYRGTTLHEIPPNGPGHRRLHGARHPRELRPRRPRSATAPEVAHLRIEAMKLAFADIWRYVADPRFMEVTPAQMLDKQLPQEPRQADRSEEGARISARACRRTAARSISAPPTPRA